MILLKQHLQPTVSTINDHKTESLWLNIKVNNRYVNRFFYGPFILLGLTYLVLLGLVQLLLTGN